MNLHAEIQGEDRHAPVVLLHGLFGRGRNLAAIARSLAASHRVITLDLRNHGASPHAPGMAYPDQAADVLETLAALEARPAGLLGHSMGGKTAMACALAAPHVVRRLLVADIAPITYTHHNAAVAAAMQGVIAHAAQSGQPGMTRAQADAILRHAVPDAGVRGFLLQNFVPGNAPGWRIGLDAIAAAMGDIEAWPTVFESARHEGPVLFVGGARSDYITSAGRDAARLLFPHARFMALKDAGHWLHADQPEAFARIAEDFFRE